MVLIQFDGLVLLDGLSVKGSGLGPLMDHGFDLRRGRVAAAAVLLVAHSMT